jgi:hypothetical protein
MADPLSLRNAQKRNPLTPGARLRMLRAPSKPVGRGAFPEKVMPQTNPFHSMVPRKLTDSELARSIRLNLEAELDAINLYAAHIDATDNEAAKAILQHVMDEEREHAALFWQLIARLDPQQAQHAREASRKYELIVSGAPHEAVESAGEEQGGGAEPEPALPKQLTVGSLRR